MLYWEQFPKTGPAETTDVATQNPKVIATINAYVATARRESPCWPVD
jgi:hypothetical protein